MERSSIIHSQTSKSTIKCLTSGCERQGSYLVVCAQWWNASLETPEDIYWDPNRIVLTGFIQVKFAGGSFSKQCNFICSSCPLGIPCTAQTHHMSVRSTAAQELGRTLPLYINAKIWPYYLKSTTQRRNMNKKGIKLLCNRRQVKKQKKWQSFWHQMKYLQLFQTSPKQHTWHLKTLLNNTTEKTKTKNKQQQQNPTNQQQEK